MSELETKPVEMPRISNEISNRVNDLRQRALKGEAISIEEYREGIVHIRTLFGQRVAAKQVAAPKASGGTARAAKPKKPVVNSDDLLDLL
jgi:hypothetical protein